MKILYLILVVCSAQFMPLEVAFAQTSQPVQFYFSIPSTTSLGPRGLSFILLSERPFPDARSSSRYLVMKNFQILTVGSDPIHLPGGFSTGDGYPYRSAVFSFPLVAVYLTEDNVAITITRNERASIYEANPTTDLAIGSDRTLIRFNDADAPREPMTAKVTGTFVKRDVIVTLQGKDRTYSFGYDYNKIIRGWVRLPMPSTTVVPAATQPSRPELKPAGGTVGDEMHVRLVDQQECGVDAHLVTVMAEAPLGLDKGRRTACYYFVENSFNGSEIKFLTSRTFEDHQPVGSSPYDGSEVRPTGKLSGSIRTFDAKFTLVVGGKEQHFKYDYTLGKWVEQKT